jgi:hypothetical protein
MTITKKDEILSNLALIDLNNFCMTNKIDCSGTRLYKYPKKYTYALVKEDSGRTVATVSFSKNSVPSHYTY